MNHWSVSYGMFVCFLIPIMHAYQSHEVLKSPLTTLCGYFSSQGSIYLSAIENSICNVRA